MVAGRAPGQRAEAASSPFCVTCCSSRPRWAGCRSGLARCSCGRRPPCTASFRSLWMGCAHLADAGRCRGTGPGGGISCAARIAGIAATPGPRRARGRLDGLPQHQPRHTTTVLPSSLDDGAEPAQTQAVRDHEHRRQRHGQPCDHRAEYPDRRQGNRGDVVGERPEQISLDGA